MEMEGKTYSVTWHFADPGWQGGRSQISVGIQPESGEIKGISLGFCEMGLKMEYTHDV